MENCYFFIDSDCPKEEQRMAVMCIKCHDEKYPKLGWLWHAESKGYGPFKYICKKCNKVIYEPKIENEQQKNQANT